MKEREIPDFWCPKCGKLASVLEPFIIPGGFVTFELAYFACGDCGLIYFNKTVVRKLLRQWFDRHGYEKKRAFSPYWREIDHHIEESKKSWLKRGWRLAIFKRKAPLQK